MKPKLITRNEARERHNLNVSGETFRRWENAQRLTPIKPGGSEQSMVYYAEDEVERLATTRAATRPRNEPPRDCRRPFGLSYAATGVSSSIG